MQSSSSRGSWLTKTLSYIVYIVLLCGYLALILLFFPETRRLSIEEVSLIFDTGRLGNASAVTAELHAHAQDLNEEEGKKTAIRVEDQKNEP